VQRSSARPTSVSRSKLRAGDRQPGNPLRDRLLRTRLAGNGSPVPGAAAEQTAGQVRRGEASVVKQAGRRRHVVCLIQSSCR